MDIFGCHKSSAQKKVLISINGFEIASFENELFSAKGKIEIRGYLSKGNSWTFIHENPFAKKMDDVKIVGEKMAEV